MLSQSRNSFSRLLLLVPTVSAQADCADAGAQGGVDLGTCLKLSNDTNVQDVYTSPAFLVNLIVKNVFVVAGVIFFLLIFYAGFKMIQGGKKGFDDAKTILTSAVAGIAIMTAAYWIVQLVGFLTGMNMGLPTN